MSLDTLRRHADSYRTVAEGHGLTDEQRQAFRNNAQYWADAYAWKLADERAQELVERQEEERREGRQRHLDEGRGAGGSNARPAHRW